MKVALCLSGAMRTFRKTYPNLKKYLLDKYNPDVFISTWVLQDYNSSAVSEKELTDFYHPKKINVAWTHSFVVDEIVEQRNFNKRNPQSVYSMFYRINDCNKLKMQYEMDGNFTYDCVIRFRPDIYLEEEFNLENLDQLNVPKWGDFGGLNDQFAFGNSDIINCYSNLFHNIVDYLKEDSSLIFNPEFLLKRHIEKNKIGLNRPNINYKLMRTENCLLDNQTREREYGFIR